MTAGTLISGQSRGEGLDLAAAGSWTAEHARTLEPQVDAMTRTNSQVRRVAIDVARIDRLDTFGAWLLERAMRTWTSHGCETRLIGLRDDYRGLFEKVHAGTHKLTPEPPKQNSIIATLESVGRTMAGAGGDFVMLAQMIGALMVAAKRVALRPWTFRLTSMINHLERVCWHAVPIILLITVLIGAILAQQGIFHFRKFGADIYVIDMVGVLVLREVGVLIVCIMVAGRSGSSYTAELGAMKMREEVDALRTMGFDPVEVLILPRIVALVIAVPILTFLGSMAALYGGGVVSWAYGVSSRRYFCRGCKKRSRSRRSKSGSSRLRSWLWSSALSPVSKGCRCKAAPSRSASRQQIRWSSRSSSSSCSTACSPCSSLRSECSRWQTLRQKPSSACAIWLST